MQNHLALIWGLASLAFVTSITPGPNNLMLMSSGMRFGLRRSLPHALGVAGGFGILLLACSLGLGAVVVRYPLAAQFLALGCALYLLHLATRLLLWSPADAVASDTQPAGRPLGAGGAILFQWVNPKAWSMAIAGAAMMAQADLPTTTRLLVLLTVYVAINLPCVLAWTILGAHLRNRLAQTTFRHVFGIGMSLLLVATAWWMLEPLDLPWPELELHSDHPALAIGR